MQKIGVLLILVFVISGAYLFVADRQLAPIAASAKLNQDQVTISTKTPATPPLVVNYLSKDERADLKPLLQGIQKIGDPESWSLTSIDFDSLNQRDPVTLPFGLSGSDVVFENYTITSTSSTTTYSGTLTIAGKSQPITISRGVNAVFASIPTAHGVIEGKGSQGNIVFRRRPVFTDFVDQDHTHPEVGDSPTVTEDVCLNC